MNNRTVRRIRRLRFSYNLFAAERSRTKFTLRHILLTQTIHTRPTITVHGRASLSSSVPHDLLGLCKSLSFPRSIWVRTTAKEMNTGTVSCHVTWCDVSQLDLSADRQWQLLNLPPVNTVSLSHWGNKRSSVFGKELQHALHSRIAHNLRRETQTLTVAQQPRTTPYSTGGPG